MFVWVKTCRSITIMILGVALSLGAQCTQDKPEIKGAEKTEPIALGQMPPPDDSSGAVVVRCVAIPAEQPQFNDGCFVDEEHAWAYRSGHPLRTTDGGRTWEEMKPLDQTKGTRKWTTDVYLRPYFVSPSRGWLTGDSYTWQTDDGGVTWRRIFSHSSDPPHFADPTHGWMNVSVTESSARSYVTEDGGETWRPCGTLREYDKSQTPGGRAHFLTEKLGWAITSQTIDRQTVEGVARTTDAGCSWTQLWFSREHPDETYFDIYFLNRHEGWLTGIYIGSLSHTTDGGKTWKDLRLPKRGIRASYIYFQTSNEGWIVSEGAIASDSGIYRTEDGARTWRQLTQGELVGGFDSGGRNLIPEKWKGGRLIQMLIAMRARPQVQ